MSAAQLQQDLQNELTTSNQLLKLISLELQQIKEFTSTDGLFANNIKQNAFLLETLASLQQVDLENITPIGRASALRQDNANISSNRNSP